MMEYKMEANTDTIRDMEIQLHADKEQRTMRMDHMQMIKRGYAKEIEAEYTETKDPALSNQTKRTAAIEELLIADEGYIALDQALTEQNNTIALAIIDLDYLHRKFTMITSD